MYVCVFGVEKTRLESSEGDGNRETGLRKSERERGGEREREEQSFNQRPKATMKKKKKSQRVRVCIYI